MIVLCLAFVGCSGDTPPEQSQPAPVERVGADRDQFGCIASAGYRWCDVKSSCVRPWELATQEGFENTEEAFLAFCENKTPE